MGKAARDEPGRRDTVQAKANADRVPQRVHVRIYTDGACQGNPGPGGWAAVLLCGPHRRELSGYEARTTNNRMELRAAIEALRALKRPAEVDLYTDSQYLRQGMEQWLPRWKRNGWRTADHRPVKNVDLWKELDRLCTIHHVRWHWLPAHSGYEENERCDQLARAEIAAHRERR